MTQKLDLLLVKPGNQKKLYGQLSYSLSGIEPPVWVGLIAAYIQKQGYSVKIIDSEAENLSPNEIVDKIVQFDPLLIGIIVSGTNPSASTMNMIGARAILASLKNKAIHIKTFLGGLHPSALPEQTLREEDVDFVCQGEGFYTILKLLETLKSKEDSYGINGLWHRQAGSIISNPRAPLVENLDELPFVAWELLPMDKYRAHNWHCFSHLDMRNPYAVVYTSLGCPFQCRFCCINAIFGKRGIRYRSPERVVEEIDLLVKNYKVKNIKILDEMFVLNENHVIEICDLIIQRDYNLNIWAYARIDTINERILKKMKQAGFNWVCFGIESGNKTVRDGVTKGGFSQDAIRKTIEMTRACGIYILGNFMFGLPDDNLETMHQTLEMAKELIFEYVNFYVTMAYPGSQLYEDALRQGIQLPQNWLGYAQFGEETLPLPTKYLPGADVLRFRDRAFEEYFSNPKYIEMIAEKFGRETVEHIKEMLKIKIHRKFT